MGAERNRFAMVHRAAKSPWARRVAIASAAIFAAGCGAARRDMHEPLEPQHVAVGTASWYGAAFAGRPTASGEIFDPKKLTAAHRTLPLGAVVQVTNLRNGRSVLVQINDRGPFKPGRILDCSEGAARALGFRGRGVAEVAIDWPDSPGARQTTGGDYWLQLGAFESMTAARRLRTRVAPVANSLADSVTVHRDPDLLRVHAGPYGRRKNAEKALTRLQEAGFDGIIVVLDSRALTAAR